MPSHRFTIEDQADFAALSGDFNPLHVDAVAARRGLAGGAVVHGVHLLMWALDQWCAGVRGPVEIDQLDVVFSRPVVIGAELSLIMQEDGAGRTTLTLFARGVEVATIAFTWHEGRSAAVNLPDAPPRKDCLVLTAADLPGRSGSMQLYFAADAVTKRFPHLIASLAAVQLASLLATTRLVGVECPGLYSLYSELHLAATPEVQTCELQYSVKHFDVRFNLATLMIDVPGMRGIIKAFLRPTPVQQPSSAELRAQVAADRYAGQRALVVGGSRGLGEVMAKALAAGGAEVVLTYHSGAQEAQAVVADIAGQGGRARCLRMDVTATDGAVAVGNWRPTHLYYMATPFISVGQRGLWSADVFAHFSACYVDGFARLVEDLYSPVLAGVFYPSSVFLDEKPLDMSEYVAAKSAGEALCGMLQKARPGVRFLHKRLPRLATDQTLSLMPATNLAALPVVLALLDQMIPTCAVESV
jgi:hypothetical protein